MSVALYGAPVWADAFLSVKERQRSLKRLQRVAASPVTASYKTVSFDAVTLMAGVMPIGLVVGIHRNVYYRTKQLRENHTLTPALSKKIKEEEVERAKGLWLVQLGDHDVAGR